MRDRRAKRARILLVEDNRVNRLLLARQPRLAALVLDANRTRTAEHGFHHVFLQQSTHRHRAPGSIP